MKIFFLLKIIFTYLANQQININFFENQQINISSKLNQNTPMIKNSSVNNFFNSMTVENENENNNNNNNFNTNQKQNKSKVNDPTKYKNNNNNDNNNLNPNNEDGSLKDFFIKVVKKNFFKFFNFLFEILYYFIA